MNYVDFFKRALKNTPLYGPVAKVWHRMTGRDGPHSLIYVHIGKCGGVSLWDAILESPVIQDRFRKIEKVHIEKPSVLRHAHYLIVVRNPVSRALSAFNWRYKLVVEDAVQKDRIPGEYEVLTTYGTLNALAEALYDTHGTLDQEAAKAFRTIHHLREDIAFYLSDLLPSLRPEQVFAVLTTEQLNADIANVLKIETVGRTHSNRDTTAQDKLILSDRARDNLRRFLADDYLAVETLLDMAGITDDRRQVLLA